LTRLLPGAYATMLLADFGAEVVKIEEPGAGDPLRTLPPLIEGVSAYHLALNRNKRSRALDLKSDAGQEVFLEMAAQADVVIENFRPGVMRRLGLDYESLRAVNPRLIYCAITGYGQDGPRRTEAGHDLNFIALAGLLGLNAKEDGEPVIPGVQFADLAGGSLPAVIGILLAVAARERTGAGQMVDISMLDGVLSLMVAPLVTLLATGREPQPSGEALTGRYACYHVYEAGDGRHLALAALEPKFWAVVCRALGREDLIARQFAEGEPRAACVEALQSIFRTKTANEWVAQFAGLDACLTPVKTLGEVLADPQVKARGVIAELEHPEFGTLKQLAPTIKLSATPGEVGSTRSP